MPTMVCHHPDTAPDVVRGAGRFSVLSRDGRVTAGDFLDGPADHLAARRRLTGHRLPTPEEAAPDSQLESSATGPALGPAPAEALS